MKNQAMSKVKNWAMNESSKQTMRKRKMYFHWYMVTFDLPGVTESVK